MREAEVSPRSQSQDRSGIFFPDWWSGDLGVRLGPLTEEAKFKSNKKESSSGHRDPWA